MGSMTLNVAADHSEPWVPADTFAARLAVVRVAMGGLNIKEAATLCQINPESWRRWEDGAFPRNLEDVCWQIHDATRIDFHWLIGGGPLGGLRTGSFSSDLVALPEPTGQGQLLDDELWPYEFYAKPALASV